MDLKKLNEIKWIELWKTTAKKYASIYGVTKLGDQDIFNSVIKDNPDIIYRLPCYWNTQLSDKTLSYECYNKNQIKVICFQFLNVICG